MSRVGVSHFNSQPHKEADAFDPEYVMVTYYFNSQPHKEADGGKTNAKNHGKIISIHSLTRRLTE